VIRLLPLLLLTALAPASAQVVLGVRGGVSAATLHAAESDLGSALDFEDRFGLTGALTAELPLSRTLSLRTELAYTMKGAQREEAVNEVVDGTTYDVVYDFDCTFDYVELPVLLEVAAPVSNLRMALFFGPTVSLNVREKVDIRVSGTINGAPLTEEQAATLIGDRPDEWVEATDVGVTLGTRLVRGRIAIEARSTLGLPVVSAEDDDGPRSVDVRNRAFSVSVGYTF
jgi:hypothetical protein